MKKIDFNKGWKFRYKDGKWQDVILPHDAQLQEQRDPSSPGGGGHAFFPGNIYEYEKEIEIPADWENKHVEILFEGVYRNATVFINDKQVASHKYGYTDFNVVLDDVVEYGAVNKLRVVADNSELPNSRWYTGGGIYRPVTLLVGEKNHIDWQGVRITTIDINPARINVQTIVTGDAREIAVEIYDGDILIAAGNGLDVDLEISDAKLWSEDKPYLYTCKVVLKNDGIETDVVEEKFGIRSITWGNKGLFVNGKETLLRGGCVHHDNGIIGAASFAESEYRRIRILKENGYNAIRVSHNPACTAMIEACDELGMYVMDETFDMWYLRKTKYDYGRDFKECWEDDVRAMVERDYNHPSVIMYSIGNEVSEPGKTDGVEQGKKIINLIKSIDESRIVTGGMNLMIMTNFAKGKGQYDNVDDDANKSNQKEEEAKNGSLLFNTIASFVGTGMNKAANSKKADEITTPMLDELDVAGYNYANGRYPLEKDAHPDRVLVGSETFPFEIGKNWGMVKKFPYLIGDFMWTSWDYLGETGIGAWSYTGGMPFNRPYPWILANVGTIDILGNGDGSLEYAKVVWGIRNTPVIAVRPVNHPGVRISKSVWRGTNGMETWSWKNCQGNKAEVEVFADADAVELIVNNRSLGKKKIKDYKTMFKTKYEPGLIEAVSYDAGGNIIARSQLKSAEEVNSCQIIPEKETVSSEEIVYVNIQIADETGLVEANDDRELEVSVEGGELLGFGSANPCHKYQYHTGVFSTYYGRAQLVARAGDGNELLIKVKDGKTEYSKSVQIV